MAVTDWKSSGTVASDDSFGTATWAYENNVKVEDNNTAESSQLYSQSGTEVDGYISKLVIDGSVAGDNLGEEAPISYSLGYKTLGGASQLWGNSLDATKINSSNFGFAISYIGDLLYGPYYTEYLKTSNYGFDIPSGATVEGVEVMVKHFQEIVEYGAYPKVDHIQIRVYYTESTTPTVGVKYPLPAFKR